LENIATVFTYGVKPPSKGEGARYDQWASIYKRLVEAGYTPRNIPDNAAEALRSLNLKAELQGLPAYRAASQTRGPTFAGAR
jgi:hypothetical protein